MRKEIKGLLIASVIVGSYLIGKSQGSKNKNDLDDLLDQSIKNTEQLITECSRLKEQNIRLKSFYNVVEGITN